ncbi:MAG: SsrA-binding protein SmpB [Nitrospinae bacterium]|nr:SsrA-binding protein SmpB [Nitrospinota bacterium]
MTAKEAGKKRGGPPTIENRRARHDYRIEETVECGIVLKGAEVKSLRTGKVNLQEAHARVTDGELWLYGMNVTPYSNQNTFEQIDPLRGRKLLAHKKQIGKLEVAVSRKGYTLIPLKIYFVKGFAKVLVGVGEGKKLYDKREDLKAKAAAREMDRARKG